MRNRLTYNFFALTVCSLLLFACKGNKQASAQKDPERKKNSLEAFDQVRFGAYFVDGCTARLKGNLDQAKALFIECNKIDPTNAAVKYELAIIYKLLGVNDQALFYAKACAQAEPGNEWYQLTLVQCYNQNKQYTQSVKVLENLVKNFPEKTDFKEDLAIEYTILGQFDKAFKVYNDLEKVFGVNEQIILKKSNLLKGQKKFKEAEDELLRLSTSNPSEVRYYSYLAEFYIEQNEMPKAKAMYDKIVAIDPNNPGVNLALHDYYSVQGKNTEAFECLKKAFMNPDLDPVTKRDIAYSFYDRRNESPYYRENGAVLAKIYVQVHPGYPEANSIYADYLMEEKRIKEASEYYYKAASKEKSNYNTWEKLLITYSRMNQYDSLENNSTKAMELFPSMANFYYMNGYANIQLRNFKKATQSLRDGLEFVVDNKLLMIDFYKNLGDAYFFNKDYDKSDKAFEDILKIDSDNEFALNQYAYFLLLRNENLERAEKLARKVNELVHENGSYMDTYGRILYKQKKYTEAEIWLSGAAKLSPKKPNILEHYGDVLSKLGKVNEAVQYWEAAKAAGSSSDTLLKKIKEKKVDD